MVPQQKLPSNIRVRLCVSGPKSLLQGNDFKLDQATVKVWRDLTGNKVPLWTYHCVMHMDSMPHIVETYPHLIKKYVSEMKEFIAGMYMETHASTFTRKLLDMYIFHRLMKNPDIDVDKEIDETKLKNRGCTSCGKHGHCNQVHCPNCGFGNHPEFEEEH